MNGRQQEAYSDSRRCRSHLEKGLENRRIDQVQVELEDVDELVQAGGDDF